MKNILITGGAGFIGSNLAKRLKISGYNVTVMDNLSTQIHGLHPDETSPLYKSILNNNIRFILGSVTNRNDFIRAIEGQDVIVHLAAETGTGQSMYEIKRYVDVNVGGTALLLDLLANENHSVKKIVVASSRAIYGEGRYRCDEHGIVYPSLREVEDMVNGDFNCKCPICNANVSFEKTTEDSKIHPVSVYGITKQNQEQMIMLMGKALGIETVSLRYQNVYGPGQSLSNPYTGILSVFSNLIKESKDLNIFEDGKESRDFVYIDDVVEATISAIEKKQAKYNTYNVGSGKRVDVLSVAKTLMQLYEGRSKICISGNFRVGDIRHNLADITKINQDLSYSPRYIFNDGIRNFVNWVDNQGSQNYLPFDHSIEEMKMRGLFK